METKNALHINSYFLTNRIHYNFYKSLLKHRDDKFFIPVYKRFKKDNHLEEVEVDYVFDRVDQTLFFTKFLKISLLLYKKKLNTGTGYDYIHAHTLMSDGIAAYGLSRLLKKKFVVTVRSTDLNVFIGRSFLFKYIAKRILTDASMVFLVSPPHEQQLNTLYPGLITNKLCLLPNGIDDFWLQNLYEKGAAESSFETVNILYVGEIIRRKKLEMLIDFVRTNTSRKYKLTVVGKNSLGLDFDRITTSISNENSISYLGEIHDKTKLLQVYRENDIFVLLSYGETFGVVYLEALSQGIPIIYTRGDGVDGYFKEGEVGYSCDHNSTEELEEKIGLIINNYDELCTNTTKSIKKFEWDHLVRQYINNVTPSLTD